MESAQGKVREIPENRIKRLEINYYVRAETEFAAKHAHQMMLEDMGREIAQKLYEFRKIESFPTAEGTRYQTSIEVIVPPIPENPCPPSPTTSQTTSSSS